MTQTIKIKIRDREYTLNNNSSKYDRAKKDAGRDASPEQVLAHYDKLAGLILDEYGKKIENGQFWKAENRKIFIEKAVTDIEEREVFRSDFLEYLKKENSNYAKLILQENLITYEIISLLFLIQSIINVDFIGKNNAFLRSGIWVKFIPKDLRDKELGSLIGYLKTFLNNSQFIAELNSFNRLRNNITHKIFYQYKKFADVHRESVDVVELWDKILVQFEVIVKDIIKSSKDNMMKEIKETDKISDSRTVINDNFKDLDERLKKVEEKLKLVLENKR